MKIFILIFITFFSTLGHSEEVFEKLPGCWVSVAMQETQSSVDQMVYVDSRSIAGIHSKMWQRVYPKGEWVKVWVVLLSGVKNFPIMLRSEKDAVKLLSQLDKLGAACKVHR